MKNKTIVAFKFVVLLQAILFSLNAQTLNSTAPNESGTRRNTNYNLEEIKVRWKKAALENCSGVPCTPGTTGTGGTGGAFACGTSTVKDGDNNTYNTVSIGTQCWTKENLRTTKYIDGTDIPLNSSGTAPQGTSGENWSTRTTGERTIYEHNSVNETNYGYLYNWYAVKGISLSGINKNICPTGWHVATDAEWTILENYLGGRPLAGGKMKDNLSSLWSSGSNPGNNESKFSALPGGQRRGSNGLFFEGVSYAYFWTSSEDPNDNTRGFTRYLWFNNLATDRSGSQKSSGYSVRCIKDQVVAQ